METETFQPAGSWRRICARVIDGLIWGALFFFFSVVIELDYAPLISLVLVCIYDVAFLTSHWQATPGKRMMNVYVQRMKMAEKLSRLRALIRFLSLFFLLFLLPAAFFQIVEALPLNCRYSLSEDLHAELRDVNGKVSGLFVHSSLYEDASRKQEKPYNLSYMKERGLTSHDLILIEGKAFCGVSGERRRHYNRISDAIIRGQIASANDYMFLYKEIGNARMINFFWRLVFPAFTLFLMGAVLTGLTRHKKGLHDMICDTRTVKGRVDLERIA